LADRRYEDAFAVNVVDRGSLAMAFGERGLSLAHFASRTDRHKAGHGIEEEIYLLRRYLSTLEASGELQYPFDVCKSERPDFLLTDHRGCCLGLEVTEATTMADQREMTLAGRKDTPHDSETPAVDIGTARTEIFQREMLWRMFFEQLAESLRAFGNPTSLSKS
jgi:hypothetical protein